MPHDNNSHIYTETVQGVKYGISTDDVAYVLGEASGDVGTLCTSNSINKYAKYKPCGGSSPGTLSETERKAVNCGIDCSDSATGCFSTSLSNLLTRAKATNDWTKGSPTWYRLLDFDGYHHYARQPYVSQSDVQTNVADGSQGDQPYISLSVTHNKDYYGTIKTNLHAPELTGALTSQGHAISAFKYALIYRDASNASGTVTKVDFPMSSGETIADLSDQSISQLRFIGPSSYQYTKTYDCCIIIYAGTPGVDFWGTFLPKSYFQAQVGLFYVEIEEQTIEVPKEGSVINSIISGFNWQSLVSSGDYPSIRLYPTQGSGSSVWAEVEITVDPIPSSDQGNAEGYYQKTVTISYSDFAKRFYIKQACKYNPAANKWIIAVDSYDIQTNNIPFASQVYEYDTNVRIKSNVPWIIDRVTFRDDVYSANDIYWYKDGNTWKKVDTIQGTTTTGMPDILPLTMSGGSSSETTTVVPVAANVYPSLPAGKTYMIKFVATDSSGVEFTLDFDETV